MQKLEWINGAKAVLFSSTNITYLSHTSTYTVLNIYAHYNKYAIPLQLSSP